MGQLIDVCDRVRWLAYFDLLGVRALLADGRESWVYDAYWAAHREFKSQSESAPELRYVWLSDTFLIIAPDDSSESFGQLESASRDFATTLLQYHIPLRGAVACERLFADFDERMFFGRALVEAYEYGEGQDWIGLLLCPSAARRLDASADAPRVKQYYRMVDIPWKRTPTDAPARLWACLMGSWIHRNNQNPVLETLERMQSECSSDDARQKYKRTLAFLRSTSYENG